MELNDWLAIIGAFGGLEAVRWGVTFWVNRKTNARKEDASADSMEDENERKQVDWLEERIAQRDAKIDALYVELRNEQSDKLAWIHKCHERTWWGKPITVNSGYRCPELNAAVKGSKTSQHMSGQAADIDTGDRQQNKLLFEHIRKNLPFDQLIDESNFAWVHVSYRADGNNRMQVLKL